MDVPNETADDPGKKNKHDGAEALQEGGDELGGSLIVSLPLGALTELSRALDDDDCLMGSSGLLHRLDEASELGHVSGNALEVAAAGLVSLVHHVAELGPKDAYNNTKKANRDVEVVCSGGHAFNTLGLRYLSGLEANSGLHKDKQSLQQG